MKNTFYCQKSDGKLKLESPGWYNRVVADLREDRYVMTLEKYIPKRTDKQNAYYWSTVVPMVKDGLRDAGYNDVKSNEDAHEILKHLFLKKKYSSDLQDTEIVIAGSTAKLKTIEFNEYLEEIWKWASEYLSINIPEPGSQSEMFV